MCISWVIDQEPEPGRTSFPESPKLYEMFCSQTHKDGRALPFTGGYESLEGAAEVASRTEIYLGAGQLYHDVRNMNDYEPTSPNKSLIARALLVCMEMISEAVRFRYIEAEIAEVSATHGMFPRAVRLAFDPQKEPLIFDTVASVRFIVALMPVVCQNRGANLQDLQMPASTSSSSLPMAMISTGLQENDDTCDVALAPTSHIIGQNEDNTIRSQGRCLTTYGYSSGSYAMIYDCDKAVPDATKWEICSDGAIINPKSGLVLTGRRDSSGMINLVLDYNIYASNQALYAGKYATSPLILIVSHEGLCLLASGSQVRLDRCARKDDEQE
ncbi:hypothetical protein V6N13_105279 [Hibiscus sabdariffa]